MSLWADAGVADDSVVGGFGVDPIGVLAHRGHLPQGIDRALADGTGLAVMAASRYPNVRTWSVDATPYAEAGASEGQELASMLSTAVAYLRSMQDAGMNANDAAARIEITLGADADFFTTIAKLRAARRTYGAMSQACGVDPEVVPPAMVVRTLHRDLSRRDPWVNLLRVTCGAFAGALGGADTLITAAFDSELGQPSALGRRMARNTQLLLSEESNVGRVIDPAGGSWYIESLTESIAAEAWSIFRLFEGAGGMPAVLTDGTISARIQSVREERATAVATRRAPITGVSEFPNLDEQLPDVDPASSALPVAAPETDAATKCERLEPVRWAEPFETLRDAADTARFSEPAAAADPRVFLVNLGSVASHTARASWAKNFFEAGGIAAVTSERGRSVGFGSAAEVAEDFAADPARIACICSSDDIYSDLAVQTARALAGAGAERVYLAGRPTELQAELEAAGVDQFIHVGVDLLEVLGRAHVLLGIAPTGRGPSAGEPRQEHR
jgi:methylmalonyl-CoA mutase